MVAAGAVVVVVVVVVVVAAAKITFLWVIFQHRERYTINILQWLSESDEKTKERNGFR
jgi:hypothetical protein